MSLKELISSKKIIGLAPMDGITDEPYRLIQAKISKPDVMFTEFVSAEGIAHGGIKLFDHFLYLPEERPIVAQLFGKDPDSFYKSTVILCELGFDGIDINMGCPAKTVTHHGSGAALIDQRDVASKIILSVKKAVADYVSGQVTVSDLKLKQKTLQVISRNKKYSKLTETKNKPTVSLKTRLGISTSVIEDWMNFLLPFGLDFITLHGRTLKQMYSGQADWDAISKAVKIAKGTGTLIWGNGDIKNRQQAEAAINTYGVDGALIGRSTMGNPWVFLAQPVIPSPVDRFNTMFLHAQIASQLFPQRRFEVLRKQFLFYAAGLADAKRIRSKLVAVNNLEDLLNLEADFLNC